MAFEGHFSVLGLSGRSDEAIASSWIYRRLPARSTFYSLWALQSLKKQDSGIIEMHSNV